MSLLISPSKCPECGEKALYNSSCRDCGYVDPEYLEWVRKEVEKAPGPIKDCMIVYHPRITVYRRRTIIDDIKDFIKKNIHLRESKEDGN